MEFFIDGLAAVLTPYSIFLLVIGVTWGVLAGMLPGMSLLIGLTLVLPFTYGVSVEGALLLIVGTAAGAQFGNGVTAIVIGVPGTPSAVLSVVEGYPLYQRGEGGIALYLNLIAAFFGQVLGAVGFVLFIVPLAAVAPQFLAPEVFAMTILGLLAVASLTADDILKGLAAVVFGLLLANIGLDPVTSQERFVFGVRELFSGIGIVPLAIGLLGLGELLYKIHIDEFRVVPTASEVRHIGKIWVPPRDLVPYIPLALFAAGIGFFVGVIPGIGATTATFIVYQQARLVARRPDLLGKGSKEGLVAQNVADNVVIGGELVPTLGLGIPGSASMTVLLGALLIHGVTPGPLLLTSRPTLAGSVAAGFLLAGVVLLPIGLAMSYAGLRVSSVWPPGIGAGGILLVLLGAFSVRGWWFDVFAIILFGLIGYMMRVFGFPVAATAIGFILGGLLETTFRRGILIARGSLVDFVSRPITAILLVLGIGLLAQQILSSRRSRTRRQVDAGDLN